MVNRRVRDRIAAKIAARKRRLSWQIPPFLTQGWFWCVLVRLFSVYFVCTSFVPDEYWQSLEVAHNLAFGYGYLTWEWRVGIRSYFYPVMIASLYKILEWLHIDTVFMLVYTPRILQALASAVADCFFVRWFSKTTGYRTAWGWFTLATSWFSFYCATRTLSNTMESVFTTIALALYKWPESSEKENKRQTKIKRSKEIFEGSLYLWFVGLACVIRPTAVLVWIPMVLQHLRCIKDLKDIKELIFLNYMPIFWIVLGLSTVLDSICYGKWIYTWLNFFNLNVNEGVAEFYGTHPSHWYVFSGFPAIMGLHLLPMILGLKTPSNKKSSHFFNLNETMYASIVLTIAAFSYLPHKEFRFLLAILPMCHHISARCLAYWSSKVNKFVVWSVVYLLSIASLTPTIYLGHFHQRGTLDVMPILAKAAHENPYSTSLLFLMPCHSTPLYSHLHVNVTVRFLTCEPNLKQKPNYTDEADIFYNDPMVWLGQNYPKKNSALPTHIICFDELVSRIHKFLQDNQYVLEAKLWHTAIPEGRVSTSVIVYKHYLVPGS